MRPGRGSLAVVALSDLADELAPGTVEPDECQQTVEFVDERRHYRAMVDLTVGTNDIHDETLRYGDLADVRAGFVDGAIRPHTRCLTVTLAEPESELLCLRIVRVPEIGIARMGHRMSANGHCQHARHGHRSHRRCHPLTCNHPSHLVTQLQPSSSASPQTFCQSHSHHPQS